MAAQADARADLRAAWDEMLAALGRARDAIDAPQLYPPPPNDRNLAEGYRYVLGFVYGAFERAFGEDPNFPYFRRSIPPLHKSTIDNADNLYLTARIDGNGMYLLRGKARDHRHWRGEPPTRSGRKAPQYAIFTAISAYTGDTGSLAELNPSVTANTGTLDSAKLLVDADGSFTILLAPLRPDGYVGNFIATKSTVPWTTPDGTATQVEHTAQYIVGRELFGDWEREDALDLQLVRVGAEGTHPRPLDPAAAAAQMRRLGETVNHQVRFWNQYYAILLETYGDMNGDGKRFMPRNALNPPLAPSAQLGAAQATNIYSGGVYELGENEALIVEERIPVPPLYIGFNLSNLWGESFDYANHTSSLNGCQAEHDADGGLRFAIAHRDPGVPNWLDTTGHPEGFMGLRWVYSDPPNQVPAVTVKKVAFNAIRRHLPAKTRTVSPEERRNQIRIRQEHVQRRYRQY
ncbi:MAG: hypothetical protein U0587_13795 [Candidatus Binatia bacterium]